jgi:hypothetical protein
VTSRFSAGVPLVSLLVSGSLEEAAPLSNPRPVVACALTALLRLGLVEQSVEKSSGLPSLVITAIGHKVLRA